MEIRNIRKNIKINNHSGAVVIPIETVKGKKQKVEVKRVATEIMDARSKKARV
jgi:hypothetical protein